MRGQRKPAAPDATVTFTFESAYNQIVQPTSYVSLSQYFIAHWMPSITGAGLKILLRLRSMGYYSPKAGVQRGDIDIEQKELAVLCGLSHSTLKRAFADDPVLSAYVQRVFEVKRDPRNGRIIKEHYLYVVKMDDVLTPEDKAKLDALLQGPDKGADNSDNSPKAQNDPSDPDPMAHNEPPMGQSDPSGVQSEPPTAHNEPPRGQNDPPLNRSHTLTTPNTFNTPDTPGAASEFSLALFSEEEPNQKETEQASPPRWQDLTEDQQRPFVNQARAELVAIHAGSGITPKPKLVEVRARNLYEVSQKGGPG